MDADSDSLLDRILELLEELLRRFGAVYAIAPEPKHRTQALMLAFGRLAREMSPRPQPVDLVGDEVVKSLCRIAAQLEPSELYVPAAQDASPEEQLLHDVANVLLGALAECGRRLGEPVSDT
jgi:hypothetical protein